MLSISIDWLSLNFKRWTNEAERFMRTYASVDPTQATNARFGYSDATMDGNGVVVQWNPDRSDMGHHVIFSGSSLRNVFSGEKISPQSLLRASLDAGGIISRLDLALDCTGQEIDLSAIYQSLEQGGNVGNARTFGQIKSAGAGQTVYVGSRQSERYIRIYNKAAQQGLVGEHWYRFEVETKGMVSRALASVLVENTQWHETFVGLARRMVDLPTGGWLAPFYQASGVPIGLPKIEKQTDREKWIEGQVLPAVARHYIENPNSEAVARLIATLNLIDRQRKE